MSVAKKEFKKVTTHSLQQMKDQGEKNIYADCLRLYYGENGRCRRS